MNPCTPGTIGDVWFKLASRFQYFNDAERTKQVSLPMARWARLAMSATSTKMAFCT